MVLRRLSPASCERGARGATKRKAPDQVRQQLHRENVVAPHDCQQNFLDGKMHCPADFYSHEMWKMHKECLALGHADSAVGQDGRFSTLDAAVAARPRSSVMNERHRKPQSVEHTGRVL